MDDILTGKKISVRSINIHGGHSSTCYVRGCNGTVVAASSNEDIATAEITANSDETFLVVHGIGEGTAIITVGDQSGQTATLPVNVSAKD